MKLNSEQLLKVSEFTWRIQPSYMLLQNNPVSNLLRTEISRGIKMPKGASVHTHKCRSSVHTPFLSDAVECMQFRHLKQFPTHQQKQKASALHY